MNVLTVASDGHAFESIVAHGAAHCGLMCHLMTS